MLSTTLKFVVERLTAVQTRSRSDTGQSSAIVSATAPRASEDLPGLGHSQELSLTTSATRSLSFCVLIGSFFYFPTPLVPVFLLGMCDVDPARY
jgi:hypothetical protein